MRTYGYIKSTPSASDAVFVGGQVKLPTSYQLPKGKVIDQGQTSSCVACTLDTMYAFYCKMFNRKDDFNYLKLYNSRSNKKQDGMSPREGFNLLKVDHKIKQFAKINDQLSLKRSILANGPALVALPVYSQDSNDFWNGSKLLGGHAIAVVGYTPSAFVIKNSWGYSYGNGGYWELSISDWNKVLELWTILN